MKTKKNKLTNFLKKGILLLGISLLLWNCEKVENEDFIEKQNLLETLKSKFNPKDFEKTLSYQYRVNWENPQKQYSEELKTNFYEFPIIYTSNFNPNELSKKRNKGYLIKYKIIVTEKEPNKFVFYIGRFYQKNESKEANNINFEPYFNIDKGYTGFTHLIDKKDDLVFAKKIEQAINPNRKIFTNKEFRDSSLKNKMALDCYEVPVYHYTDWYYNGSYARTVLNDITYETVCYEEWLPDLPLGEGVGAGTYSGTGNGNSYSECTTDKCKYKIGDKNIDCGNGYTIDANGNCVENVPQIFLDPSFENSFANCAYNLLTENNLLKDILKKLIPKDSEYDVTFKVGNSSGNGGNTSASYGTNGDIIVTINKDLVDTGNIVSISETILHEAVHAKLFEMVKSIGGLDKLNEFTNEDSEIGRLAACYNKYGKPELQHEFIWSNYVNEIAKGTEIIHKLFPDNYNRFHSYMTGTNGYDKNTFYKKVTQAGLSRTSYFKSLKNDTISVLNMYSKLKANGKKITNNKTCK